MPRDDSPSVQHTFSPDAVVRQLESVISRGQHTSPSAVAHMPEFEERGNG